MKQNRWVFAAAALLVIAGIIAGAFALFGGREEALPAGNLIENADFSRVSGGQPEGWERGMWVTSSGASYLEAVTLEDGTTAALVENVAANDARFEQKVAVRENATYRLSAKVMAEGCDPAVLGANVSFLGIYGTSNSVHDTAGAWETVTLYGQTGKGQKEVTVCARLGGYGAEVTGKAWFTDMELTEVSDVPVGVSVLNLATPEPRKEAKAEADGEGLKAHAIALLTGASALYLLMAAYITHACLRRRPLEREKNAGWALGGVLLLGFIVRFVLAMNIEGYGVDMGCFSAWAGKMAADGPARFYEEGYFCDYPPAYMLVLGATGLIANALGVGLSTMQMQLLLKLSPIVCDLALAALLWRAAQKKLGERAALGLAALTALNPAFIVTGSCWGQIDSVLAVLLAVMLLYAQEGRWTAAIPVFAFAVLAKPQAGLLAPLGIAALIKEARDKRALREMGRGVVYGLLVTAAVVLPFSVRQQSPFWLVNKYVETLSSYNYATLSTGNLMFLLGGNWTANETVFFGPVTYGMLGMGLMIGSFAFGIWLYMKGKGRSALMLSAAITMQMVFVLGSKMHERYILPALALMALAYIATQDVRVLSALLIASAASAVNIGVVLAFEYLIAPNMGLGYVLSVLQIAALGLMLWAGVDVVCHGRAMRLPERTEPAATQDAAEDTTVYAADVRMRRELLSAPDAGLHMAGRDWAIMLALTLAYAVVGFAGLGATDAPQTGYVSTQAEESVVLDLGQVRKDFRIYYYGGISDTQFSFAVSDDGEEFSHEYDAFFGRGECFKWQALRAPVYTDGEVTGANGDMTTVSGRYLRVTFKGAASALWEVAAVDQNGAAYPVTGSTAHGAREGRGDNPAKLVDEQDTVPLKPTYMNSMYFDEIYHARTGYEHANSLYTYETTHPPLGKVFMSWCIDLMGMTPFAWRFAGALTGVLMIPAMYLLAKQLLGGTLYAFLCAFLMSVDCMHFTQTRIATIDSFPVLFIMLMFLCMARWTRMSFYHTSLKRTFIPLALSGAFMGLAISSKWIGCYSAVGLAVLFFARFYTLWRQSIYAAAHRDEDPRFAHAADVFPRYGLYTILACCVFFVLVPVIIYCLSYIPYLSAYGEVKLNMQTIGRLIDAQIYMFEYHKDLVAEHYFASPWYEWPVIAKPMWYYSADFKGAGMASSILAFGNPAVWWTGLAGILFVLGYSVYRNALPALRVIPGRDDDIDRAMPVMVVGFLSAYLPWVLISRLTFIYHYFASVPFIILATAQGFKVMMRERPKAAKALMAALCVLALALFIVFYPLASGIEVPRAWCDAVSWFDNWMWY